MKTQVLIVILLIANLASISTASFLSHRESEAEKKLIGAGILMQLETSKALAKMCGGKII